MRLHDLPNSSDMLTQPAQASCIEQVGEQYA